GSTEAPAPPRRRLTRGANGVPVRADRASDKTSENSGLLNAPGEMNTGNDLRPLDTTGFVSAMDQEEPDDTTGRGTVPGSTDATIPPSAPPGKHSGNKPKN